MVKNGEVFAKNESTAHLMPTGINEKNTITQGLINESREIINDLGIGLNHPANGFKTICPRHLGTYAKRFWRYFDNELIPIKGSRAAVIQKLKSISLALKDGVLKF